MPRETYYALIVDTNKYTGNFEREMCAWMTGRTGECGVGDRVAEEARDQMPEELREWAETDVIRYVGDRCYRPVEICPSPADSRYKGHHNSLKIELEERPSDALFRMLADRASTFKESKKTSGSWKRGFEVLAVRLVEIKTTRSEKVVARM